MKAKVVTIRWRFPKPLPLYLTRLLLLLLLLEMRLMLPPSIHPLGHQSILACIKPRQEAASAEYKKRGLAADR